MNQSNIKGIQKMLNTFIAIIYVHLATDIAYHMISKEHKNERMWITQLK